MRKQKVRAATLLPEAVEKAFSAIHISDCIGWFCVWICAIIYWIAIDTGIRCYFPMVLVRKRVGGHNP